MIGLGFAGVGALGEALIRDVPKFADRLRVAAVQDVRQEMAEAVAGRSGAGWAGPRFEDLLGRADVDAVVICTPNALHAAQAQAALRAAKHVLVQKPLAVHHTDAVATLAAARACERLLFVDYSYRFLETVAVLRHELASAWPWRSARAVFHNIYGPGAEKTWFFEPALSGGGALIDLGVHLLDLAVWLAQPAEVMLRAADLGGGGTVETWARLQIGLEHVPLEIEVSWNAPRPATEIAFEVECTSGRRLRWENVDGSFFRFRTLRDGVLLEERETTLREDTLRAFLAALDTGQAPPVDARVYALLNAAYGRHAPPTRL